MDFLTKKRVRNNGIVLPYYVTDDHEAIIPRDLYVQVQEEMQRRANLHSGKDRKKRVYSRKYALSSIVYCSKCGDICRRIAWNNRGKRSNVWRCVTRVESGPDACDAETIQETELQEAVIKAINSVLSQKSTAIGVLQEKIEEVIKQENSPTKDVDGKLEELQKQPLQKANRNEQYGDLVEEIYKLREEKHQILADKAEMEGVKQSIGYLCVLVLKIVCINDIISTKNGNIKDGLLWEKEYGDCFWAFCVQRCLRDAIRQRKQSWRRRNWKMSSWLSGALRKIGN